MRVDTRSRLDRDVEKGVVRYGSRRIHAIQTETIKGTLAYCGRAVVNARGSSRTLSCEDCKKILRRFRFSG
jgi:hypothetical protein